MGFTETSFAKIREIRDLRKNLHRRDEHFSVKDMEIKRRKNIQYDFPKASKSLLNKIKETGREDRRKQIIKTVFILLIALMLTMAIIGYFIIVYNK